MPRLFEVGGGAGIGSYIVVIQDGQLLNPNAEKIRASYDNGENLYLSILDESTQEALLPLTGYVDNEGILHLAGRDFDDNKTYDLAINNGTQSIELNTVDGITMGEGTIPTEGGGGDITLKTINNTSLKGEGNLELVDLSSDQTIMGDKTFGSFRQSTVTKFYGNLASVDTIDANGIHFGAESGKRPIDASRLLAYNSSDYAGQGKTLYAGNGITYYYKTYEEGQLIERSYKLDFPDHKNGIIATTEDLPNYYEVHVVVDQGESESSVSNNMVFNISSENLDIFINESNTQLEPLGYELTKDNWSTLVPQLGSANDSLRYALIKGLLILSNNAVAEDIDGFSNMICVGANGTIKLGYDQNNYIRITSSTITPINNKF